MNVINGRTDYVVVQMKMAPVKFSPDPVVYLYDQDDQIFYNSKQLSDLSPR